MILSERSIRKVIRAIMTSKHIDSLNELDAPNLGSSAPTDSLSSSSSKSGHGVPQITGDYPKENIELVIKELKAVGITNPNAIMGVLAVVAKESGFVPQNETGYSRTSNSRIMEVFKYNTLYCDVDDIKKGTKFSSLTDAQITSLKSSNEKFFNAVYGGRIGNNCNGDGWKYRGRGFNQLTGRANYRKAGYENNPDAVNGAAAAAKVVAVFMTEFHPNVWSPKQLNSAKTPEEGANMAADINGGQKNKVEARKNALARIEQFKSMFKEKTVS